MIKDTGIFRCSLDNHELIWPEAKCTNCGSRYSRGAFTDLRNKENHFPLYDFRESSEEILQDRRDFHAHKKVIEGLLCFEKLRINDAGYSDLKNGLERDLSSIQPNLTIWAHLLEQTLRNLVNALRTRKLGQYSQKNDGDNSIQSSWRGYSKTYELISNLVQPTWFGWVDGELKCSPVLIHHYRNMLTLSAWLKKLGAKTVLEFGCGSGINLLLLQKVIEVSNKIAFSAFDYSDARLLTTKATDEYFDLDIRNLFLANGLDLPIEDNSFDLVFSHYVIEQMSGFEERAVNEMLRVSKKGLVLFETALEKPTLDQRVYMKHSGYSTDLTKIVRQMKNIRIVTIENLRADRFYGSPNVLIVILKNT